MIKLLLTFIYVGITAIGGGLATIPILIQTVVEKGWITEKEFYNIIAISESTPGPIGLNIATYIGYTQKGLIGAIITSFGLLIPSFIIILIMSKLYKKYSENKFVKEILKDLRLVVVGIVIAALMSIFKNSLLTFEANSLNELQLALKTIGITNIIDFKALVGILLIILLNRKIKISMPLCVVIGSLYGIIVYSL